MQTKSKFMKLHEIACFQGGGANMSTSSTRTRTIALAAALLALPSFADPLTWEGATNLTMTANTTVVVPAGATNVIDTLAGAYTLTKTGGGVLEVRYSKSASAKFVVSEGLLRFANPRPDDIFAKAYFHVDASDLSSMEIETVNGTNFVTRWNDTDGRTDRYATHCTTVWNCRKDPENRKPFLRMNFQNGLSVMDFGSLLTKYNTNEVGQALGYGAAMKFDQTSPYVKEGFTVASDTEDYYTWTGSGGGMSFFSHETEYRFTRCNMTGTSALGVMNDNGNNNNYFANGKSVWLDATLLTRHPKWAVPSPGFHIVRIRPSADGYTTFNSFGAEFYGSTSGGNRSYGGQRIAEYALFTNRTETGESAMTTNEAAMVNRYLRVKWFPQTIAAVTVAKGASLDVDKSANLTIQHLGEEGAENLSLTSSNILDVLDPPSVYVHFDASATNTLEIETVNGTNFVTRWNDAGGRSLYAENITTSNNLLNTSVIFRPDAENRKAFISYDMTETGLPVVDFGTLIAKGDTAETGGYGAAMFFGETKKVVMAEGFIVSCDNEHLKERAKGVAGPSFFGNEDGDMYGRRGDTPGGNKPPPLYYYSSSNDPSKYCSVNGRTYLDGEETAYTTQYPEGFHVVDTIPSGKMLCNALARNYRSTGSTCNSYGGTRIGEFIILSEKLSDDGVMRARITNILKEKWLGMQNPAPVVRTYNKLELAENSSLIVKYEAVAVTNKLTLAGSLAAPSVFAANVDVSGTNAMVNAPLTVPDGAALSFARQDDGAWTSLSAKSLVAEGAVRVVLAAKSQQGLGGTLARLVAAETPIESIDGWTLEWDGKHEATMSLREGDVWVEFAKTGSIILFR